ncbi:MAG TPA: M48 family metalloprotease [Pseudomonadota bacterium]|nr:M48 family metalloprotease [Pseudomonadota bacterium]HQX23372.1 M48 family metalloprotease [Pseudomonadota bacterium]HQY35699.1 M48 family metalloprotease [Pseudomonadota bacterium]HRA38204.1 M48 family metalloprotease [Pseudomonadota bacterium]
MKRLLLILAIAATSMLASAQDELKLPDFGSSAGGLLSPDEERRYGEGMLRELRSYDVVLDDPLIADYIEGLGWRLVAVSERPEQPFTFFVVRSTEINAFAAPGGYVGVNTGLITMTETEDELAAVLGHECAHVIQRHLVRAYESMRNVSIPIALAMLGALIAASGSSNSGDAAQAAVIGGQALMQQQQINFTRYNEYEADRIGINILAKAGYDPMAMAVTFQRMGRAGRSNGDGPPEYLRTHPVTVSRVSEAKARADTMRGNPETVAAIRKAAASRVTAESQSPLKLLPSYAGTLPPASARPPGEAGLTDFLLFRERSRVLGGEEPLALVNYYRGSLDVAQRDLPHYRYGLALALTRAGRPEESMQVLGQLVGEQPDVIAFGLGLAEAEAAAGRHDLALRRLAALAHKHPGNKSVTIAYADELTYSATATAGREAIELLRPQLNRAPWDPLLQRSFARACELAGEEVRAGEAHAEVALLNGQFSDALNQLVDLLRRDDVDYYQRARIEARIAEITPYALEQRRRLGPGEA